MVRLKVDENLATEVTTLLNDAGHDAMSIHDQNMVGTTEIRSIICRFLTG